MRTGNVHSVMDGDTGFLFEVGDDEALASYIIRLIRDPGESRILGECGRIRVRSEFSMAAYLNRMETLYTKLLGDDRQ